MSMNHSRSKTGDIARSLLERSRDMGRHSVLFLGSRAGGLFRSPKFYEICERFGHPGFNDASQIEQFDFCYRVLKQDVSTQVDLDDILRDALLDLSISESDQCLAEMVKQGIFDIIISTNVDNLLEQAFLRVHMQETKDFRVSIPRRDLIEDILPSTKKATCSLVKIFGDFVLQEYNITKRELSLDHHKELRRFLTSCFSTDVLMVGYDPLWDHEIDAVFPAEGQAFWFINEEEHDRFQGPRKGRGFQSIIGGEGSYEHFLHSLHWYVQRNGSYNPQPHIYSANQPGRAPGKEAVTPPSVVVAPILTPKKGIIPPSPSGASAPIKPEKKVRVCIFHAIKDHKHLDQLKKQFKYFERGHSITVWDETSILPGRKWVDEVKHALKAAEVVILLVSPDFLASAFIDENVLPPLLKTERNVTILPVVVEHCPYADTALAPFKTCNDPDKPLNGLTSSERNKIWAELVTGVIALRKRA